MSIPAEINAACEEKASKFSQHKPIAFIDREPPSQLLLENAVLLAQVIDGSLLVAVDLSSEGHEQPPQRGEIGRHGPILPCLAPSKRKDPAPLNIRTTTAFDRRSAQALSFSQMSYFLILQL